MTVYTSQQDILSFFFFSFFCLLLHDILIQKTKLPKKTVLHPSTTFTKIPPMADFQNKNAQLATQIEIFYQQGKLIYMGKIKNANYLFCTFIKQDINRKKLQQ